MFSNLLYVFGGDSMSSLTLSQIPPSLLQWLETQAKQKAVSIEEQALQMLLDAAANTDKEQPAQSDVVDALLAWREEFYEEESAEDFVNPVENVRSSSTGQKNPWHP